MAAEGTIAANASGGAVAGYVHELAAITEELRLPKLDVAIDKGSYAVSVPKRRVDHVPGFLTRTVGLVTGLAGPKSTLHVLNGVTCRFRAASSTLILGAPGSGKSTLLRCVAGHASLADASAVTFNGESTAQLKSRGLSVRKLVAYAPQEDIHEPLLTVKETLAFAHANAFAALPAAASERARSEAAARVQTVIDILGLRECQDTIVGNDQIRGISGGQKKRVTIGEALLSGSRVLALDQITDGLDSSTALEIAQYLSSWSRATGGTVIAALQAPTPEIMAAFDDVLVLSDGKVLFQGPVAALQPYLFGLGFAQPSYVDTADYAVQIATDPAVTLALYAADTTELGAPPAKLRTIDDLAAHWSTVAGTFASTATQPGAAPAGDAAAAVVSPATETAAAGEVKVEAGAAAAVAAPAAIASQAAPQPPIQAPTPFLKNQFGTGYRHSVLHHTGLLLRRQAKLMARNKPLFMAKIMQSLVMGLIIGSLFWQVDSDNFVLFISLAFFGSTFLAYSNMAEVPVVFVSKQIVHRHLAAGMYPSWAYSVSAMLSIFPVTIIADMIFCTLLYWIVGYANDAGRYFFWCFCGIAMDLCMSAMFRFYAIAAPSQEFAGVLAGAGTGLELVYGGFLIARSAMKDSAIPLYYFTPFSWVLRSMSLNQFFDEQYAGPIAPVPNAPSRGETYASIFGFQFEFAWKISGPFVLLGYYLIFGVLLCSLAYDLLKPRARLGTQRIPIEHRGESPQPSTPSSPMPSAAVTPGADAVSTPSPVALESFRSPAGHAARDAHSPGSLPFQPITLAFKDITYQVYNPRNKQTLKLLQGISGCVQPGSLVALMGASGAGKTTLLDVLADRKNTGKVGGEKRVNGQSATPSEFARLSAYCEQVDIHMGTQTVKEAIAFSASLRLGTHVPADKRAAFVDFILSVLELQPLQHRLVLTLAPGEAKILTIAVEMASGSPVLFLDEPTTGLDSRSAATVMRVIKNVAATGRTCVATIHQPSAATFYCFTHLLLLAPGGHQVFAGALGHHAQEMVRYLEALPGVKPLPANTNPATWMVEQTRAIGKASAAVASAAEPAASPSSASAASPASPIAPMDAALPLMVSAYQSSTLKVANDAATDAAMTRAQNAAAGASGATDQVHDTRPGFLWQLGTLLHRESLNLWRSPSTQTTRLVVILFVALFFGITFQNVGNATTQNQVLAKLGTLFSGPLFVGIVVMNTILPSLFMERSVFYRERAAHYYKAVPYALAVLLRDLPWLLFFALMFSAITYFIQGLRASAQPFFIYVMGVFLTLIYFEYVGVWIAGLMPNPQVAQIFGGVSITLINLFAGLSIPVTQMPKAWQWMYYADGVSHNLRLLSLWQFTCEGQSSCPTMTVVDGGAPRTIGIDAYVEDRMGMTFNRWGEAVGWLIFIAAVFALLATTAYRFVNHQKR